MTFLSDVELNVHRQCNLIHHNSLEITHLHVSEKGAENYGLKIIYVDMIGSR